MYLCLKVSLFVRGVTVAYFACTNANVVCCTWIQPSPGSMCCAALAGCSEGAEREQTASRRHDVGRRKESRWLGSFEFPTPCWSIPSHARKARLWSWTYWSERVSMSEWENDLFRVPWMIGIGVRMCPIFMQACMWNIFLSCWGDRERSITIVAPFAKLENV